MRLVVLLSVIAFLPCTLHAGNYISERSTLRDPAIQPKPQRPDAPTDVSSTIVDSSTARIRWQAAAGDIHGYNVYRNGNYLTTVFNTEYTATGLARNTDYRFEIVTISRDRDFSSKSRSLVVNTEDGNSVSDSPAEPTTRRGFVPDGYRLVFSDEFNQRQIDSAKWNTRYRWGPWWIINSEQQFYVDQIANPDFGYNPFELDGEHLIIKAIKTPDYLRSSANNQRYLSGALSSHNKFNMRYGYVEMRARMPRGRGLWPAFWLLHSGDNQRRPEIDVVEMLGHDTQRVYQTYHWYNNGRLRSTPSYQASGRDHASGFHTYGMHWQPGSITWYVDGVQTNQFESGDVSSEDMYLLLNLAVGGRWPGSPNNATEFPTRYSIDYIRAYAPR